jgi:hypothetical protein
MPEIQVIFPAATARSKTQTVAQVLSPTLIANEGEKITWIFCNCDSRVVSAEIVFPNPAHTFFANGYLQSKSPKGAKSSNQFRKDLTVSRDIYGTVPQLSSKRPVPAKYTVRGLNASGDVCSEVDPEIIVNEP